MTACESWAACPLSDGYQPPKIAVLFKADKGDRDWPEQMYVARFLWVVSTLVYVRCPMRGSVLGVRMHMRTYVCEGQRVSSQVTCPA